MPFPFQLVLTLALSAPAVEPAPDPTTAVVAQGVCIYRQRDLDALVLVSLRHAREKAFAADGRSPLVTRADEDRIRQVLIRALTAREALAACLAELPGQVPPRAREAIALDLLAYQAETAPPPVAAAGTPAAPAPPPVAGPVLIRLPPLTLTRAIAGKGRRQLTLGMALAFPDAGRAKALESQAPLIQDAILGCLHGLPEADFAEPDFARLKEALATAIRAKAPAFPVDGLLIAQLDAGAAD
jgi:flagellar basal body-associated protein FliL